MFRAFIYGGQKLLFLFSGFGIGFRFCNSAFLLFDGYEMVQVGLEVKR